MGADHQRCAQFLGGVQQHRHHPVTNVMIKLSGGLVSQDERRPAGQHPGHRHPLRLTTGNLLGQLALVLADP
jgi:hypothetical protein